MTKKILFSLILALGIFGVNFVLAVTCPSEGSWDSSSGVCIPTGTGLPSPSSSDPVATVLENVMQWLLAVIGVVGIIAFVISGVQYLMAAGDQNIIETAKRNMKWSIVGIVVALSGLIILNFIFSIMDGTFSTSFGSGSSSSSSGQTNTWTDTGYDPWDPNSTWDSTQ